VPLPIWLLRETSSAQSSPRSHKTGKHCSPRKIPSKRLLAKHKTAAPPCQTITGSPSPSSGREGRDRQSTEFHQRNSYVRLGIHLPADVKMLAITGIKLLDWVEETSRKVEPGIRGKKS
jgi:hypothetical protein